MELSEWRTRIDEVDQALVELLNRRMEYVLEIGKIKRALGRPVRDPEREKAVLARLTSANKGPMSAEAVVDIFSRIMQEARALEEKQQ